MSISKSTLSNWGVPILLVGCFLGAVTVAVVMAIKDSRGQAPAAASQAPAEPSPKSQERVK